MDPDSIERFDDPEERREALREKMAKMSGYERLVWQYQLRKRHWDDEESGSMKDPDLIRVRHVNEDHPDREVPEDWEPPIETPGD